MMNPEFKRNLWLSFSRHKLIAMPALLGLTFLALAMSDRPAGKIASTLYAAATGLFMFIVWLWGARNANLSIVDELRDKTWDQQRMSALDPWSMTWGKLLGSTSFNWYGGAFCLAVAIPAAIAGDHAHWWSDLLSLIAVAFMLHAALIALNLYTGQLEMQLIQRGGLGWLAIIFVFMSSAPIAGIATRHPAITWWGTEIETGIFLLASAAWFAACAIFAAWRVISNALQVRTTPWAWPLFALMLAVYCAGLAESASDAPVFTLDYIGLLISATMTYATLFTEPLSLLTWNRLRLRQQKRDWRGWLEHLPLWPTTLLVAFCFAVLASVTAPLLPAYTLPFAFTLNAPLTLAFMLLRDAGIVVFFSLAPSAKRPAAVALLYLVVINGLLPFFFKVARLDTLSYFFLPYGTEYGATASVLVMATHAAIALGLVAWRLRRLTSAG